MADDSDQLAHGLNLEKSLEPVGFLAEEKGFDRHVLWRLGSWAFGAVGAVTIAVLANQYSIGIRRDVLASADLTRQTQQIKSIAGDSQAEARRLASAVDTLNADRDRLYSRITALEMGLNTVTGSISSQIRNPDVTAPNAAPSSRPEASSEPAKSAVPGAPSSAPKSGERVAASSPESAAQGSPPVLSTPPAATPAPSPQSGLAASDPAPAQPVESASTSAPASSNIAASVSPPITVAAVPPASSVAPDIAVQRTEFGVDLGGASSLDGLRALWRVLTKSNTTLAPLRPIVVVKESGAAPSMQLRLVAGPLGDAAAAAKICASLTGSNRSCETTVFDGQRLAMKADTPPVAMHRPVRKRIGTRKPQTSSLSSFLGH